METKSILNEFSSWNLNSFLSGHKNNEERENLLEHSKNTLYFFERFVRKRGIEFKFDGLGESMSIKLIDFLRKIIFLHDIGKINKNTQEYFEDKFLSSKKTSHSDLSFILILLYFYDEIKILKDKRLKLENRKEEHIFAEYLLNFIFSVFFHHSSLLNFGQITLENNGNETFSFKYKIREILDKKEEIIKKTIDLFPDKLNFKHKLQKLKKYFNKDVLKNSEKISLFFNLKLFYSLLVLSDYYATYSFQHKKNVKSIKINQINEELINIMQKNFYKISYNSDFKSRTLKSLKECDGINELRNNLILQSSNKLKKSINENKKIFMLNVPTGGGKTNISLKLALDIIESDRNINRLYWVFPFVNIIEQNYNVIKETYFGLKKGEYTPNISKIYHESIDLTLLENYDNKKIEFIEKDLNLTYLNNPINVISDVNFFNGLFKVKSSNRYKFANFTNSVVIIDEIQSLNADYLDLFYRILDIISKQHNIYFIIMSATLPNINHLLKKEVAVNLIENFKDYFNHSVFERNKYIFTEKRFNKESFISFFNEVVKQNEDSKKFLIVFNTIKTSIEIFKKINDSDLFREFNVFLLNSFIQGEDKKKIISFIKKNDKKVILVSTQSIEAGVDLDFDVGIRDIATLDSLEQVAGRVNRECSNEKKGKVYIIDYSNESNYVYANNEKFKILKTKISSDEQKNILKDKLFDKYYNLLFELIKFEKEVSLRKKYLSEIKNLNFEEISKLDLIEMKFELNILLDKEIPEINKDFFKKNRIYSVLDLFFFIDSLSGFDYIPLKKLISKIINKNSLRISFFSQKEKEEFIHFLNKNYGFDKKGNYLIIPKRFKNNYFKRYSIEKETFEYFDLSKLKKDIKESTNSSLII